MASLYIFMFQYEMSTNEYENDFVKKGGLGFTSYDRKTFFEFMEIYTDSLKKNNFYLKGLQRKNDGKIIRYILNYKKEGLLNNV